MERPCRLGRPHTSGAFRVDFDLNGNKPQCAGRELVGGVSGRNMRAHDAIETSSFVNAIREASVRVLRSGPSAADVSSALALIQLFPGIFAAAYDRDGRYRWVSSSFAMIVGTAESQVIGRSLNELFSAEWCAERLGLIRRALDQALPLATVEVFRGRRLEAAVVPVEPGSRNELVIYVGRFGLCISGKGDAGSVQDGATRVFLETADWGPLAVLTRRELEILRLIALGLDNPAIAQRIHRTKRAVEWHIQNLYARLNCGHRAELYRLGMLAGLHDIDEAHWERMMTRVRIGAGPEL